MIQNIVGGLIAGVVMAVFCPAEFGTLEWFFWADFLELLD